MKLQEKTSLILVLLLILVIVVISIFVTVISLSSYSALEREYVSHDVRQAVNKINDEADTLSALVSDWAPWDDTYNFISGDKPDFIKNNLLPESAAYKNLRLNLLVMTDSQGNIVYAGAYDMLNDTMVPVPESVKQEITLDSPLLNMTDPRGSTSGILMLPESPMIVASRPIVHTDFSGTPRGVVIMGRYLDPVEVAHLATMTHPSLGFTRVDDPALQPLILADIKSVAGEQPGITLTTDPDTISGYALIRDIHGKDALVLHITQLRDIYHQGTDTTFQFILIFLVVFLGFGLVIMLILDRLVLSRLNELSRQVKTISQGNDPSKRVAISGSDEFTNLATDINQMLETISATEQRLRFSETRFREITDLIPQIIFELDQAGKLTYVNRFGMEIFGLTLEDMNLPGARQFIVPEEHERMFNSLKIIASGGKSPGDVYTLIKKDGTTIRAIILTAPILQDGTFKGFRGSAFDITDRIKLEEALMESEEKYRALIENTPDLLFSADMNGVVTYVSPQVNQYGYLEDDVVGHLIFEFIHPEERRQIAENFRKEMVESARFISTFRIIDKWGNFHWFEEKSYIRLDKFGKPTGIYGVLRDISERKRVEEAIELANKKLNLLNSITRHDILNTITGLIGCVDMAEEAGSAEEQKQLLHDIKDLTKIIQSQITFTKDYQEVGVNKPAWQNVQRVIQKVLPAFSHSGLQFIEDIENVEIFADPLLEKVFYNLIDNAIRYGEKITLIRFYLVSTDNGLSVVCEDDGTGIPENNKEDIFRRGVGKNTGMGLFLSREILAITNITIRENGVPESGGRFEMSIPFGTFRFLT